MDIGQDVHVSATDLYDAVNEGVRMGYTTGTCAARSSSTPSSTGATPATTRRRSSTRASWRAIRSHQVDAKGRRLGEHGQARDAEAGGRASKASSTSCSKPSPSPDRTPALRGSSGVGVGWATFEMSAVSRRGPHAQCGSAAPDPQIADARGRALREVQRARSGPRGARRTQAVLAVHVETMATPSPPCPWP